MKKLLMKKVMRLIILLLIQKNWHKGTWNCSSIKKCDRYEKREIAKQRDNFPKSITFKITDIELYL